VASQFKNSEEVKQRFKEMGLSENFCVVPFTTLLLEPNGNVGMCRQKGTEHVVGNIKDNTISEIWNSETLKNIRKEFLSGEIKTCAEEQQDRLCYLCPQNTSLIDHIDTDPEVSTPILKLGANFNGLCNLKCQMCDIWQAPNGLYDDINFWEPATKDIFPYLKEIDMLSGEPFIQKDTYRLIDIVSEVNPTCEWTITTNAHWTLNDKIRKALDKIIVKNLIISIDSVVPDTYAKIRTGGKLSTVLENVENIRKYATDRGIDLGIKVNYLIQKDNWREITHIFDYHLERKDMDPFVTFLYLPEEFSLLNYSEKERMEILDFYFDTLPKDQIQRITRVITPLVMSLSKINRAEYLLQFKAHEI
jgi:radical SAM protein with 4Fe4S-binding SPASM domain